MALTLDGTAGITFPVTAGSASAVQASSGRVLQVVQGTTTTSVSNSTITYADTGLTATITPSNSSSKIVVLITHAECAIGTTAANRFRFQLLRNGTVISPLALQIGFNLTANNIFGCAFSYVDSPASTSALTYKTQFSNDAGAFASVIVQNNSMPSTIILMEIAA
jgi:hypothetical protein